MRHANDNRYEHRSHCKGMLKVHLIFVTRFRKPILTKGRADSVKQYLYDTANTYNWKILIMETDKDHVHMLVQYPPTDNVTDMVKTFKQASTHRMWKTHGAYLKKGLLVSEDVVEQGILLFKYRRGVGRRHPEVHREPS